MKYFILFIFCSCQLQNSKQIDLKNEKIRTYSFLKEMYRDSYFPNKVVDKGKDILINLCWQIEKENPKTLDDLYKLTHRATNEFNNLQEEFFENGSEIETVGRECIAQDFEFIAISYGFDADIERLIATRDW